MRHWGTGGNDGGTTGGHTLSLLLQTFHVGTSPLACPSFFGLGPRILQRTFWRFPLFQQPPESHHHQTACRDRGTLRRAEKNEAGGSIPKEGNVAKARVAKGS